MAAALAIPVRYSVMISGFFLQVLKPRLAAGCYKGRVLIANRSSDPAAPGPESRTAQLAATILFA